MLNYNPKHRITPGLALQHPFLTLPEEQPLPSPHVVAPPPQKVADGPAASTQPQHGDQPPLTQHSSWTQDVNQMPLAQQTAMAQTFGDSVAQQHQQHQQQPQPPQQQQPPPQPQAQQQPLAPAAQAVDGSMQVQQMSPMPQATGPGMMQMAMQNPQELTQTAISQIAQQLGGGQQPQTSAQQTLVQQAFQQAQLTSMQQLPTVAQLAQFQLNQLPNMPVAQMQQAAQIQSAMQQVQTIAMHACCLHVGVSAPV